MESVTKLSAVMIYESSPKPGVGWSGFWGPKGGSRPMAESESETLHRNTITYNGSFRDFQFLQGYMARRIFAKNRRKYAPALLGVVLCAVFLTMTMVLNVRPYRTVALFGT